MHYQKNERTIIKKTITLLKLETYAMKKHIIISRVREYVGRHWFKLILLLLIVIACFRKDLNFSLSLNSANKNKKVEQKKNSTETQTPATLQKESNESTPLSILGTFLGTQKKTDEFPEIDEPTKMAFMRRFIQVAVAERKKYGVPSSLILANALRQSFAGKRELTLQSNNHFSLPCTFDWTGYTIKMGDDCYRKYENAWLSFRDHSIFITSGKFAELRSLGSTNYKGWANGLQKLGYPAGGDHLADDLIDIIEKYQLHTLDSM